jgi:hypothetical protein
MMKLFILSDCGVPTGYGRIADEVGMRVHKRGYQIMAASVAYDGLLPPQYEGTPLPYWVGSLAEHANWVEKTAALITSFKPDVVLSIQDFPYHEALLALVWRALFLLPAILDGYSRVSWQLFLKSYSTCTQLNDLQADFSIHGKCFAEADSRHLSSGR